MTKGSAVNGGKRATKMKCDKMVSVFSSFIFFVAMKFNNLIRDEEMERNIFFVIYENFYDVSKK